jgi:hypothetical protein
MIARNGGGIQLLNRRLAGIVAMPKPSPRQARLLPEPRRFRLFVQLAGFHDVLALDPSGRP